MYLLGGLNRRELVSERIYRTVANFPATIPFRILAHVGQRYDTDQLAEYDYGEQRNQFEYGTINPPIYNTSLVTNPFIALWHGTNDFLVAPWDIERLKQTQKGL